MTAFHSYDIACCKAFLKPYSILHHIYLEECVKNISDALDGVHNCLNIVFVRHIVVGPGNGEELAVRKQFLCGDGPLF